MAAVPRQHCLTYLFRPKSSAWEDEWDLIRRWQVTMYNNPAFQMFLMATVDRYWPRCLQQGEGTSAPGQGQKIMVVHQYTGLGQGKPVLQPKDINLLFNATILFLPL